ncbi:hypothetical protein [Actinoplanes sp. N902-109]|uniref:hypothetical protein n=1 Tax=Actinoplanes sp. (strain N902-109) TaxID=649831 RepID=UPI0003295DE4|nr:hypothetical protein [Actinoplanes sp. N902-109]AGL19160.1 hypothetical protein L083_5650 [Actinoplanes sp. N902-109]
MATPPYVQALEAAGLLMGRPAIKGIPLWRGPGLAVVRLLVQRFAGIVRERYAAPLVEHDFLASQADNRQVFGDFGNVYEIVDLAGNADAQLRSDNIVSSVGLLDRGAAPAALIAVGSILRHFPGRTAPLFRDRLIWPVVEVNQLAPAPDAPAVLDFYRGAVERFLAEIAIPAITLRTDALDAYGKRTYLTVAALPDGRPTVLATLYLLAEQLQQALGSERDVVDVGFTGKVLATVAMVHTDNRGLMLPAALAPVQVGITVDAGTDLADHGRRLAALQRAGIRFAVRRAASSSRSRSRAEKAWHRQGVPLVLGLDRTPGSVVLCARRPLRRETLAAFPGPEQLRARLDEHDAALRAHAQRLLDRVVAEQVRVLCTSCAGHDDLPVFGAIEPPVPGICDACGGKHAHAVFVSAEGRFY